MCVVEMGMIMSRTQSLRPMEMAKLFPHRTGSEQAKPSSGLSTDVDGASMNRYLQMINQLCKD